MDKISRRRFALGLPLIGATAAGFGFYKLLLAMRDGHFDPRHIESPISQRSLPQFALNAYARPQERIGTDDLRRLDRPILLNFFASWCIPCILEMPELRQIRQIVPIWGIAYKDKPKDIARFLAHAASPYTRIALDRDGMVGIEWGITGVPESFLILPGGRVAWHSAIPLTLATFQRSTRSFLGANE